MSRSSFKFAGDLGKSVCETDLERKILKKVQEINFHMSNYEVIEEVAKDFNSEIKNFNTTFLTYVYDKLIEPAKEFGYYFENGRFPSPRLYRTSSHFQYGGNDVRFSEACVDILRSIEQELGNRNRQSLGI